MAEILGAVASAATLAALFKTCLEAFDTFRTARNQAVDIKKLTLKFNIEKCRLYIWGQTMGLTSTAHPNKKERPLDACPFPGLVHETLELIVKLLGDSSKLKDKYGCKNLDNRTMKTMVIGASEPGDVLQQLNASFDNFKIKSSGRLRSAAVAQKASWVIYDRSKFESLICEAKTLIDGLQDITRNLQSRAVQQDRMSSRIRRINDVRALDWISEVCEVDYPELSDAASTEADALSENRTRLRDVQEWKDRVRLEKLDEESDTSSVETTIAALEDMTVTELKHKFSAYLLRAKEARLNAESTLDDDEYLNSSTTFQPSSDIAEAALDSRIAAKLEDDNIEAEYKINQQILVDMAEANIDKDFQEEISAIEQYFRVLKPAEQAVVFYKLGDQLKCDANLTRFFAHIQSHRVSAIPYRETPNQPRDKHYERPPKQTHFASRSV
jgi:Prion-inhibition and propagation